MKTKHKFKVTDKHTGETIKRYVRERDAIWAAVHLCDVWGKGRYIVKPL